MIKEIRLENFKAFGSEQRIPLKPITLIYGANSTGKSSILNALLLQKQTYEESIDPKTALLFKGSLTDQQNFSRCVNNRDVSKKIKICLGHTPPMISDDHSFQIFSHQDSMQIKFEDSMTTVSITADRYFPAFMSVCFGNAIPSVAIREVD